MTNAVCTKQVTQAADRADTCEGEGDSGGGGRGRDGRGEKKKSKKGKGTHKKLLTSSALKKFVDIPVQKLSSKQGTP